MISENAFRPDDESEGRFFVAGDDDESLSAWPDESAETPEREASMEEAEAALTKQERRDLRHGSETKNWPRYWRQRLAREWPDDLPEELAGFVLDENAAMPSAGHEVLERYVNGRLRDLRERTEAAQESGTPEMPEARPPVGYSRQELADLAWPTTRAGWVDYWRERAVAQPEAFPAVVRWKLENGKAINGQDLQATAARLVGELVAGNEEARAYQRAMTRQKAGEMPPMARGDGSAMADRHQRRVTELREDAQHAPGTDGWERYWLDRFSGQGNLPASVRRMALSGSVDATGVPDLERAVRRELLSGRYESARQEEMALLRESLNRVDRRESLPVREQLRRRTVGHDESSGRLYVENRAGRRHVTEGDIVADMTWGIEYAPSDDIPHPTWRRLSKLVAVNQTKANIRNLRDRELAELEHLNLPTSSWTPEYLEANPRSGAVAERMAQTMLKRMEFDLPELGLRVQSSNPVEDHLLKYDFSVIASERHRRGVAMSGEHGDREAYKAEKRRLGIQFTINDTPENTLHKEGQVSRAQRDKGHQRFRRSVEKTVDDIVLVAVSLPSVEAAFQTWRSMNKPSGGPEQFLSAGDREGIIKAVLAKLPGFDEQDLEKVTQYLNRQK
jgi:hypothetical protein